MSTLWHLQRHTPCPDSGYGSPMMGHAAMVT
jgi:hypothetical protein